MPLAWLVRTWTNAQLDIMCSAGRRLVTLERPTKPTVHRCGRVPLAAETSPHIRGRQGCTHTYSLQQPGVGLCLRHPTCPMRHVPHPIRPFRQAPNQQPAARRPGMPDNVRQRPRDGSALKRKTRLRPTHGANHDAVPGRCRLRPGLHGLAVLL